jgi:hypothetical protein
MADGQPLYACASCGIRDFDTNYIEEEIQKLPEYFIFNKKDKIKFAKLQAGVRLMSEHGKLDDHRTDLSPIMSSYLSCNGQRYHLHPELVNSVKEICHVCSSCLQLIEQEEEAILLDPTAPDFETKLESWNQASCKIRSSSLSIAAGYDYGVLSRIKALKAPSILERALLSPNRAYYI